jgi:hypothetical protein
MGFMLFEILGIWFRGLLGLAIPILAAFLLTWWYDDARVVERAEAVPIAVPREGGEPAADRSPAEPNVAIPAGDQRPGAPPEPQAEVVVPGRRVFHFQPGWNRATAEPAAGLALLAWALAGRWIGHGLMSLGTRPGAGAGAHPEAGRFLAQNIPRARPVTLSPARHLGQVEHHNQFDGLVADFAGTCLAAATGTAT